MNRLRTFRMTERRQLHLAVSCLALVTVVSSAGCGGGTTGEVPPPPPSPDFVLNLSASSATISQGTTSSGIQVSIQPLNGFSGSVQVTVGGVPSGVIANPQSPFTLSVGGDVTLLLGASASAAVGGSSISVQGTSGSISHATTISLTVQSGVDAAVPRTTYSRTDAQSALEDPLSEPHHRHMVYDSANHHLFVANRARNRVEIFSTQDGSRVGSIDVAGASSVDLSADGKTLWVGTTTEQIASVDTSSLQRTETFQLAGIMPIPNTLFDRPEEVAALSGGKLLVRLRQADAAESLLALWDPASNALTDLTSLAPQIFQSGVGLLARSGDHSRVLVASNDGSGNAMVLDGNAAILLSPKTLGAGALQYGAGNSDGSRFAVILGSGNAEQLLLLDSSLAVLSWVSVAAVRGLVFSLDSKSLYLAASQNGIPVLLVLASSDLHTLGTLTDLTLQGVNTEIEDSDETGFVFGLGNRGVDFLDASQTGTFAGPAPVFSTAPALTPSSGSNVGGTAVTLSGQNFGSNPIVEIGREAALVASSNAAQIQATSPPSAANGAVNVTAYFSNGGIALAPDAFSYGPQMLEILPNAASNAGGDTVAIYGYGFGEDSGKVGVQVGSAAATVQKIEDLQSLSASLGLDPTYPFPLQRITLTTPSGLAGKADLTLTSPSGSTTVKQAFQYLQTEQVFAKAGFYKFILYDPKRQWLYLSNIDHLDVFDLSAGMFRSGISPPGGPPPNALIRQATLTPEASQLLVADFGAQSIYLIEPDTAAGTAISIGGIPGAANSGPVRVAATSAQTVFVGLAAYGGGSPGCSTCLAQMNLSASPISVQTAPQPQVSALTSAPLVEASADGSTAFLSFAEAPGQPMAGWAATTPGQFLTAQTNIPASDIAVAPDGTSFASQKSSAVEIRDADLALLSVTATSELEQIPQRTEVPGIALHPSGALVYVPFLTGAAPVSAPFTGSQGGVDIFDAHTGRLRMRVMLPEPLAMLAVDTDGLRGKFLTIDENGQRMFALTASGLTVVTLARVPLGIGTIVPAGGPAAGGTTVTIRGSGFQSGATLTIGGKSVAATFVDMNTLKIVTPALPDGAQRIVITNSDGESVSWDAAFIAN